MFIDVIIFGFFNILLYQFFYSWLLGIQSAWYAIQMLSIFNEPMTTWTHLHTPLSPHHRMNHGKTSTLAQCKL